MLDGVLPRQRPCPTCAEDVRDRSARWCGTCGAPLRDEEADTDAASPARGPLAGPRGVVSVVAVAATVLALVGSGVLDGGGAGSTSVQDGAVAAPAPEDLDRLDRRQPPLPEPTLTEPTCTHTADLGCFRWTVEAAGAGFDTVTVADGLLLTEEALDGVLVARSVADGRTVWAADLDRGFSAGMLEVAGDLVLHTEVRDLVARDLTTGRERWRTDALDHHAPYEVHRDGDVLVVAGISHRRTGYGGGPPNAVAAGLDPATGEVRWLEEANEAWLAADGTAVLTSRDGYLRAYTPTGELRWRTAEPLDDPEPGSAWVTGHVVVLRGGEGRSTFLRLSDGATLGVGGEVLGHDDRHTFAELHGGEDDRTGGVAFALLDEDGEVWRTGGLSGSCLSHAGFTATTVEVVTCSESTITLDRTDGTTVLRPVRSSLPRDDAVDRNPYVTWTTPEADGRVGSLVLSDARSATEVGRLPPDAQPLTEPATSWREDLGGVVVWRSERWLAALGLPGGSEATPGVGPTASVVWPARRGWR